MALNNNNYTTLTPILNQNGNIICQNDTILVQNNITQECSFLKLNKEMMKTFNITQNEIENDEVDAAVILNKNETGEDSSDRSNQTTATSNETAANDKMWNDETTLFLIKTVGDYDKEFSNSVKKNVWVKVAQECKQINEKITPQACDSKWKALKRTYKSILIHNNSTGQRKRHWKYYEVMHEIMYKKPEITPVATCSGSSGLRINEPCSEATGSTKNSVGDINTAEKESSFTRKRKQKENEVERRHSEKMQKLDRFNDILERMLEKM